MTDKSGVFNGTKCGSHNWVKRAVFLSFTFTLLIIGLGKYLIDGVAADVEKTDVKVEKIDDKLEEIKILVTEINTKLAFIMKEK